MAEIVRINTSHIKNFQKKDKILTLSGKKIELLLTKTNKLEATELRGLSWANNAFWSIFSSKSVLKSALEAIYDQIHSPEESKTSTKTLLKLHEISKLAHTHEDQKKFLKSLVFKSCYTSKESHLFQGQDGLQDFEIHIAGHHFQGVFLKLNEQQRGGVLQANGTLKTEVIETLVSPVAISHDDIILSIQEIFGEVSFFLSDSESVNNEISLIQDRAWSLCYGAQSFYKPSGDSDFERYGSISEQQFLSLTDLEKIQLFQIRGIMGGAISAIKVRIANNPNMNEWEKVIHLNNLTKGKYAEFHREFSRQYFFSKKIQLKEMALKQLKEIALNLVKLDVQLKNRNEKLKLKSFTLKSIERQIEIKEKAIDRLKRQELPMVTLRGKKNFTQKDQQTLSRIKKSIKQKECQLKKLNDKLSEFKIEPITILNCGIKSHIKDSVLQSKVQTRILAVFSSIRELQQWGQENYPISEEVLSLFSKMEC